MTYSIDENSLLYKTLEFNQKYILTGGNEENNNNNDDEPELSNWEKFKSKLPNHEQKAEARRQFFEAIIKVFGAIMYLLYLPLIPWIKITKSVFNNMGKIFNGTLMPL